jgi:hypothetical protein
MYCYRFNSEEHFLILATAEGLVTAEGQLITNSHTHSLDPIGTIYTGGTYDAEGNVITAPTPISGYHVNAIGIAPDAWDEFLVVVNSPARVFLGGATQAPGDDVLEELIP